MEVMIVVLSLIIVAFIVALIKVHKLKNEYLAQYKKWENEYWLLRSYASNHLMIHLSWLPRGEDNCIKSREKV